MPTYEFKCKDCDHRFTKKVSMEDKDRVTCPKCESEKVEQVFSSFSFFSSGGGCSAPSGSPFT